MNPKNQNDNDRLEELTRRTQLLLWWNIFSVGTSLAIILGGLLGVLLK